MAKFEHEFEIVYACGTRLHGDDRTPWSKEDLARKHCFHCNAKIVKINYPFDPEAEEENNPKEAE